MVPGFSDKDLPLRGLVLPVQKHNLQDRTDDLLQNHCMCAKTFYRHWCREHGIEGGNVARTLAQLNPRLSGDPGFACLMSLLTNAKAYFAPPIFDICEHSSGKVEKCHLGILLVTFCADGFSGIMNFSACVKIFGAKEKQDALLYFLGLDFRSKRHFSRREVSFM